jgi:hypothetical protein
LLPTTRKPMNNTDFTTVVSSRLEKINAVLPAKGKEYASDTDRLHNFKVAARMSEPQTTPEMALWGMLTKHLVSVLDIVVATKSGAAPPDHLRDEKLGDAINYLILLEALLIERAALGPPPQIVTGTNAELHFRTVPTTSAHLV